MTRRDYIALAEAFRRTEPEFADTPEYRTWRHTLESVAQALQADNPRFDYSRFSFAASN